MKKTYLKTAAWAAIVMVASFIPQRAPAQISQLLTELAQTKGVLEQSCVVLEKRKTEAVDLKNQLSLVELNLKIAKRAHAEAEAAYDAAFFDDDAVLTRMVRADFRIGFWELRQSDLRFNVETSESFLERDVDIKASVQKRYDTLKSKLDSLLNAPSPLPGAVAPANPPGDEVAEIDDEISALRRDMQQRLVRDEETLLARALELAAEIGKAQRETEDLSREATELRDMVLSTTGTTAAQTGGTPEQDTPDQDTPDQERTPGEIADGDDIPRLSYGAPAYSFYIHGGIGKLDGPQFSDFGQGLDDSDLSGTAGIGIEYEFRNRTSLFGELGHVSTTFAGFQNLPNGPSNTGKTSVDINYLVAGIRHREPVTANTDIGVGLGFGAGWYNLDGTFFGDGTVPVAKAEVFSSHRLTPSFSIEPGLFALVPLGDIDGGAGNVSSAIDLKPIFGATIRARWRF